MAPAFSSLISAVAAVHTAGAVQSDANPHKFIQKTLKTAGKVVSISRNTAGAAVAAAAVVGATLAG